MAPFIPRTPKASHSIGVGTNLLTESEARQLVGAIVDTGRISAAAEIIGRRLRAREPSPEPLVAELEAIVWAMRALARYTLFVPRTRVHVVDPAHI